MLPVAAYGFLIYKLATYDNYAAMVGHFQTADVEQYFCLLLAFCLFPLNVGLDGFRWRYMLRQVEPMTLWDANRQVYYGFLGAFLTPYRMGDYPTRAMLFHNPGNWHMALAYGGVTAFATTMVIVLSGLPSAFVFHPAKSYPSRTNVFAGNLAEEQFGRAACAMDPSPPCGSKVSTG